MVLQRIGHNLQTEQQQQYIKYPKLRVVSYVWSELFVTLHMSKTVVYFQEGSPAAATVDSHYAYLNQLICLNSNPLSPVIFFFFNTGTFGGNKSLFFYSHDEDLEM